MTTPDVSVVIVNYNAGVELTRALESIAADLGARPWEAVVVDNASSDDSAAAVARVRSTGACAAERQNLGFRARRQPGPRRDVGAGCSSSTPTAGWGRAFASLLRELDRSPAARHRRPPNSESGRVGAGERTRRPRHADGAVRANHGGTQALPNLAASRRNVVVDSGGSGGSSLTVDWLSGACMLARRDVLVRSRDSTSATSCTGRMRTCAGECGRSGIRCGTCRPPPRFTGSVIPAETDAPPPSAPSTRARISTTPSMLLRRPYPNACSRACCWRCAAGSS